MTRLSLSCLTLALALAVIPASNALAHCVVGSRFFPSTLKVEDPCVNDEFSLTAAFFKGVGQLPVDRSGARGAGEAAIRSGLEVLERGELFGIYPEGTRSPDGRLYRGKPGGLARVALASGAPVIPVAMIDTEKIQPPGKVMPKLMRPGIRIGRPLDFSRYQGMEHDRFVLRAVTDEVMYEIMKLSGQEYVDIYATAAKRQIAEAAKAEKDAEKAAKAALAKADKEKSGS